MIEVKPHISQGNILTENPDLNRRASFKNYYIMKDGTFIKSNDKNLSLTAILQNYLVGWKTTESDYFDNLKSAIVNYQTYKTGNITSISLIENFETVLLWINFHYHNNYNLFLNLDKNELVINTDFSKFRNTRGVIYKGNYVDIQKAGDFEAEYLSRIFNLYLKPIKDIDLKKKVETYIFKNYKLSISEKDKINYPSKSESAIWIDQAKETAVEIATNFLPDLSKTLIVLGAVAIGVLILKKKIEKKFF